MAGSRRGKQPSRNKPSTATPKDRRLASTPGHKKPGPKPKRKSK